MKIKIVYWFHYDHGEYPSDEQEWIVEIGEWEELPDHLRDEDNHELDVIRIEVL